MKRRTRIGRRAAGTLAAALLLAACGREPARNPARESTLFPEIDGMALVLAPDASQVAGGTGGESFFIDRFEVTRRSFAAFVNESGWRPENEEAFLAGWSRESDGSLRPEPGTEDFPVTFVSRSDALAYAKYYGKDLPTREQWLLAALGRSMDRPYPWGDQFMVFYCNTWRSGIRGPSRVGTFEYGRSEAGCYDMVGNVAEWTATPEEEAVSPAGYYIQGGSWSDGGNPRTEERVFDLSRGGDGGTRLIFRHDFAEEGSRNNTLGFRCIRKDALSYVRDRIVPGLGRLSKEDCPRAVRELSGISEPLFGVLKTLQFQARTLRTLPLQGLPVRVRPLDDPRGRAEGVLLCYDDGSISALGRAGEVLWSKGAEPESAPFVRFDLVSTGGEDARPDRIVTHSRHRSLLEVLRVPGGGELWRTRGLGRVESLAQGRGGEAARLLVDWYTDDRYARGGDREVRNSPVAALQDEMMELIDFHAQVLLTRDVLESPLKKARLSLFAKASTVESIGPNSLFPVDRIPGAGLCLDEELQSRFWIQLVQGAYDNMETSVDPEDRLAFYDLDTGALAWSLSFPGSLLRFPGLISRPPLVLDGGERVAVAVSKASSPFRPQRGAQERIYILDGRTGAPIRCFPLPPGARLSAWGRAGKEEGRELLAGVVDEREFFVIRPWESGPMTRLSLQALFERTDEYIPLEEPAAAKDPGALMVPALMEPGMMRQSPLPPVFPDARLTCQDFWSRRGKLWLLAATDSGENALLFTGFEEGRFKRAYDLKGVFNHQAFLGPDFPSRARSFFWIWDRDGDLYCFDGDGGKYLWCAQGGNLTDLAPAAGDTDGDGSPEGILATFSGDLFSLDLATGRRVMDLGRPGTSYLFVVPFPGGASLAPVICAGIRDLGLSIVRSSPEAGSTREKDLAAALSVLKGCFSQGASLP